MPAEGMIALPGFVDSHRHTWQSLLRATAVDWTLAQYFAGIRGVMGRLYTPDDMYVANLLGALEALDAGITTLYDWSHNNNTPDHADEAVRGLRDAGIRGVYGYGNANDEWIPPSTLPTNFADIERVRRTHFAANDQLLTMAFAARGPQFTTLDITEDEFRRARDLDLRITVHVGDGVWGTNQPVMQLAGRGLLGSDVTYVHCNTLADEEFRLIGESGGTASISPEVELQMGHGWLATMKLLAAGVRPSLSIDIVTSIAGDMFGAMRTPPPRHAGGRQRRSAGRSAGSSTRCRSPRATSSNSPRCKAPAPPGSRQAPARSPRARPPTSSWSTPTASTSSR